MLVIKSDSTGVIYPADNCSWKEAASASGHGYTINTANFYGTGAAVVIANPVLGFIGKSGRFVKISD
jgi:hypothetical protein